MGTLAFAVALTAWGLLAPLARKFEDDSGLTNTETSILIAIPVVLGALLLAVAAGRPTRGWVAGVVLVSTSVLIWFAAQDPSEPASRFGIRRFCAQVGGCTVSRSSTF